MCGVLLELRSRVVTRIHVCAQVRYRGRSDGNINGRRGLISTDLSMMANYGSISTAYHHSRSTSSSDQVMATQTTIDHVSIHYITVTRRYQFHSDQNIRSEAHDQAKEQQHDGG